MADVCFVAEVDGKILSRLAEKNFRRVSLSVQKKFADRFKAVDTRGEEFLMTIEF
ncbi:MAG: hypothetical protein IKO05_11685 [Selenomonadaceae bacterium]|nr:hypothetical protein [Selenomonadaceae bacterium]